MRIFGLVALTALLSFSLSGESARAQAPVDAAAPQDKLQLKVLEWLPAKGEYREWTAVGGEYMVSPERTITVPFVGTVSTASRSLGALAGDIADALQRGLSLPTRPEVSIEMIARAPVYVLGGVETPGKVEFTPGLTALQAIALAGGFYRGGGGSMRLERDTINAEGDLREARDASARLQARVARLEAELADAAQIKLDGSQADAKATCGLFSPRNRGCLTSAGRLANPALRVSAIVGSWQSIRSTAIDEKADESRSPDRPDARAACRYPIVRRQGSDGRNACIRS